MEKQRRLARHGHRYLPFELSMASVPGRWRKRSLTIFREEGLAKAACGRLSSLMTRGLPTHFAAELVFRLPVCSLTLKSSVSVYRFTGV